jgi:hypothetical protein
VNSPKIDRFIDAIRKSFVNGGIIIAGFEPDNREDFDVAARLNLVTTNKQLSTFLTRPSVRAGVPELQLPESLDPLPINHFMGRYGLEGLLIDILLDGGAYKKFDGVSEEARRIGREYVDELVGDNVRDVLAVRVELLTKWFYDVAWDHFLMIYDQQERRFWLICITETG